MSKLAVITLFTGFLAVGLAVMVTLRAIIPALRNTCTLFNKRCTTINYRALPNGQILVKDPVTSLTYWYDGNYIRSYGPTLPGSCPKSVALDATGATVAVGDVRKLCERYDADGICVSSSADTSPPTALDGAPFGIQAGSTLLEPAFVMNAYTLNAVDIPVLCSRARNVVETSFENMPMKSEKIRIPAGQAWLDAKQIFTVLRNKAYTPPLTDPDPPICNGHGFINPLTSICECERGYTGSRCATRMCADDDACVNGTCNGGLCECAPGWTGDTCALRACPGACVNGQCDGATGACVCTPGFTGALCNEYMCVPECGVHGTCNTANGTCTCEPGWIGQTCSNVACPNNCSGNGVCLAPNGVCECVEGWVGADCATTACLNNCNLRGECNLVTNTCTCDAGWSGEDCAIPICPNGCCEHGSCSNNTCTCDAGWSGLDCSVPDDPLTTAALCPTLATCSPVDGSFVVTYGSSDSMTVSFKPTNTDADGYRWFASVQREGDLPFVEVGFKVVENKVPLVNEVMLVLYGKARGRRLSKNWWSRDTVTGTLSGTYAAPGPITVSYSWTPRPQFYLDGGTGILTGCYYLKKIAINDALWGGSSLAVLMTRK